MRILHVADLHYRSRDNTSRPDPVTGMPSVLLSVDRCFGAAVDVATDRGLDAAVIAGDVFETRNPDALALNLFAGRLRRLYEARIPVVIIPGNHDGAGRPGQPSVLEVFHDPPDVYVSTKPEVVVLEDLAVATLPWVSRAQLMAARPELSHEQAELELMEGLVRVLGMLRHEAPDGSVLALHWSIEGATLSSEADISLIPEQVIPLGELEGPWSYVAAGHIHRAQPLGASFGAYSGSVDRRNFGEEAEDKVAFEVDLALGASGAIELPARRYVTLEWNVDIDGRGYDSNVGPNVAGAIVRVVGHPSEEEAAKLDRAALQRSLLDAGADIATVQLGAERADRRRDSQVTESLDVGDALERFLDARQVEEEKRPQIRDRAKALIEDAGG